jgi:ABC-type amino acid transport substrate-binding protein
MRLIPNLKRVSWRDLATSIAPFALALVLVSVAAVHYLRPAPPTRLAIAGGPAGSSFRNAAERYAKILARNGVRLDTVATEGSQDNLRRLLDERSGVDVGFVQGGLAEGDAAERLVSLGSLFFEPVFVFYRSAVPARTLSELRGRRVAVGPQGSGTRTLALALLKANGLEPGKGLRAVDLGGAQAVSALLARRVDAVFMMSDSSVPADVIALEHAPEVRLFDVVQTDAYLRRFRYLSRIDLGPGSFDLGANIPRAPLTLLAPTVELIARPGLHPALSDLLIEAAQEVHGRAGLLHRANEFPAPLDHEYPISEDAARYYKSGKALSYRLLPFWLASIVDRVFVVIVPAILVLVPALRLIPSLYNWRIHARIHRRYAELIAVERVSLTGVSLRELQRLRDRVEEIDRAVINLKVPASFASQVYGLREHIEFVRARLAAALRSAGEAAAQA